MKLIRCLIVTLFVLLGLAVSASAQIQIQSFPVSNWNATANGTASANPELRIYISVDTTFKDGTSQLADSPGGQNANYVSVVGTVSGTTLTFPTFSLEPTTNATPTNGVYNAWIFSQTGTAGVQVQPFPQLSGVAIPATIATMNPNGCSPVGLCAFIPDIVTYNRGPLPVNTDFMTYSRSEIDAKVAAVQTGASRTEKFIVQTPDVANIPNAQALSALSTGILKSTTATGVLSIAVSGVDYLASISGTAPITITGGNTIGVNSSNLALGANLTFSAGSGTAVLLGTTGATIALGPNVGIAGQANSWGNAVQTFQSGANFILADPTDTTKKGQFDLSGITTGNTRTIKIPDAASATAQNFAAVSHQFLTSFNQTTGAFAAAQPAFADISGVATAAQGGTGINNGSNTITLGGNVSTGGAVTFSGAFSFTGTLTAATSVTFPTSGTLVNSAVATLSSLSSIGTITTGAWNGTAIGTIWGGTGQNWGGSSGLPSLNAGAFSLNAITQNGVAYGGASNAISFSNALANAVLITSGASVPTFVTPAADIVIAGSSIDTVQPIQTTSTPRFAREGLGQAAAATTILGITGPDLSAAADQTVGSLQLGSTLASNNAGGGITLFDVLLKPTFNVSAGSSGRTFVTLGIDSTNTQLLGTTTRWLINANDGGTNRFRVVSDGSVLIGASLSINGGTALTTTNQTGSGSLAMAISPVFTTPNIGAATATTINGLTVTSSTGTLTVTNAKTASFSNTLTFAGVDGKTETFNNSLTFAGTDSTTMTFPTTSATIARSDAAQTFTGVQTFGTPIAVGSGGSGAATFTANGVLLGNGASAFGVTATGPANSLLAVGVAASAPLFSQTPILNTSLQIGLSGTTGSLILANTNGFTTTFQSGALAANRQYNWPVTDPTAGQVLSATTPAAGVVTLSWVANGSGGGSPGAPTNSLQFNNSGALGGLSEWLYSSPTVTVTKNSLNTALTDLLVFTNTTAALSNQKQYSGTQHFSGTTWDNSIGTAQSVVVDHRLFEGSSGANDSNFGSTTITNATNATPIQITTSASHGYTTGQQVVITGVGGNTNANSTWFIQNVDATHFNLIGSTGNAAYTSGGKVARAALGWLGVAAQYNGGGYSIVDGIDTNGHMFLNSATPTSYSAATLQVTGPVYHTSSGQAIPYTIPGFGGSPPPYTYVDYFLNVTASPFNANQPSTEFAMAVNLTMNSNGATDIGVGAYFGATANKSGQAITGINPAVSNNGLATVTTRGAEVDVNQNVTANPPDPGSGTAGFADGVDAYCGGTHNCSGAFVTGHGTAGEAWKAGFVAQAVGYTSYTGIDPSIVYGDNSDNVVYGLNCRTCVFQANPTNKISAMVAGPYGVPSAVSLNSTAAVDVPLIQLGTIGGVANIIGIGQAATTTTSTQPFTGGMVAIGVTGGIAAAGGPAVGLVLQVSDTFGSNVNEVSVATPGFFRAYRANGSTTTGYTALASGDVLGAVQFFGYDGASFRGAAVNLRARAAEPWTNAVAGGALLDVFTTPTGTQAAVQNATFQANGGMQLNTATATPVVGDLLSSTQNSGIWYVKGNKLAFAYNNSGTLACIVFNLDHTTTTFANANSNCP